MKDIEQEMLGDGDEHALTALPAQGKPASVILEEAGVYEQTGEGAGGQ